MTVQALRLSKQHYGSLDKTGPVPTTIDAARPPPSASRNIASDAAGREAGPVSLTSVLSTAIELNRNEAKTYGVRIHGCSIERALWGIDEIELMATLDKLVRRVTQCALRGSLIVLEAFTRRGQIELRIHYRVALRGRTRAQVEFDTVDEFWTWRPARLPANAH